MRQVGKNVLPYFGHLSASQITAEGLPQFHRQAPPRGMQGWHHQDRPWLPAHLPVVGSEKPPNPICPAHRTAVCPATSVPRPDKRRARAPIGRGICAAHPSRDPADGTTPGRIGALLELTWDQVDLSRRMIKLAPNDLGPRKGRATDPINNSLIAAFQTAKLSGVSDHVIEWDGRTVGSIKTGFNAAVKRAGIRPLHSASRAQDRRPVHG
ncbi:site-specific integrase [Paracoccus aminovorans]|uniref:hypothetical protein n=1 Tax=Paracoccus aminovorans TaxID=34004 RepID=UPI002B25709C|nr:hypothetical protein [Paracoccus aminovorans]